MSRDDRNTQRKKAMDFQTHNNNIRGVSFSNPSEGGHEDDDLVFDPQEERKRIAEGTEEYLGELRREWATRNAGKQLFPESVVRLSEPLRNWMLSIDRTSFYDRLAAETKLSFEDRIGLAKAGWEIALGSNWGDLTPILSKYIQLNPSAISLLTNKFSTEFLPKAKELSIQQGKPSMPSAFSASVPEQKSFEQLSLLQALGKYQNLGNQQITGSKIAIKGQNDPVRPTIFNWLKAYRDELGVGRHDAVVRGNFLFHSINGKGLSAEERERLGMILKSLDENVPVSVDPGKQEIVFQEVRPAHIPSESVVGRSERREVRNEKEDAGVTKPAFAMLAHHPEAASYESRARNQEFRNERTDQNINNTRQITEPPKMSEQIELGKLAVVPGGSMVKEVSEPAPASVPRRVSFEPAKIEKFEFGTSSVSGGEANPVFSESIERFGEIENTIPLATQNPKVAEFFKASPKHSNPSSQEVGESSLERSATRDGEMNNVGSVVFTTKHVLPAEKEAALEAKKSEEKPKATPNTPLSKPAFDIPKVAPKPKPSAPAQPVYNPAYRIRPMSHMHKQEEEKENLPPNVVNLKE